MANENKELINKLADARAEAERAGGATLVHGEKRMPCSQDVAFAIQEMKERYEAECAALAKECEELRADKARLDWLENQKGHLGTMHLSQCFNDGMGRSWFTKDIRAAIDAARADAARKEPPAKAHGCEVGE